MDYHESKQFHRTNNKGGLKVDKYEIKLWLIAGTLAFISGMVLSESQSRVC